MTGPTRRREGACGVDRSKVVKLYVADGLSASVIAERFGISGSRVAAILTEEGVPLRNTRRKRTGDEASGVLKKQARRSRTLVG